MSYFRQSFIHFLLSLLRLISVGVCVCVPQMEFCEKSTLRNVIDAGLYMDVDRVWQLFREITEGLLHIHEQVCHSCKICKKYTLSPNPPRSLTPTPILPPPPPFLLFPSQHTDNSLKWLYDVIAGNDPSRPEASQHLLGFQWPCQDWWLWTCYHRYYCSGKYAILTTIHTNSIIAWVLTTVNTYIIIAWVRMPYRHQETYIITGTSIFSWKNFWIEKKKVRYDRPILCLF